MLFSDTIAVYCENHTKHTDSLREQNAELQYLKVDALRSQLSVALVSKRTILTERPPLAVEVSANLCG
jgi:riboflavin biosynthesis pyrimidine reductase